MADSDKLLFGQVDLDFADDDRPPMSGRMARGAPASAVVSRPTPKAVAAVAPSAHDDDAADSTRVGKVDDSILSQLRQREPRPLEATSVVNPTTGQTGAPPSGGPQLSDPRIEAMRELYASGDADGALFIASAVQAHVRETTPPAAFGAPVAPDSDVEVGDSIDVEVDVDLDDDPHAVEEHTAISASGVQIANALRGTPRLLMSPGQIAGLPLDPRAGFLMMHFDGFSTIEDILDACAMPRAEATTIIRQLLALKVIVIEG